jgi:hypothetical protein
VLARLRDRYGPGPLPLRVPGRSLALVLSPGDVHRVLAGSPEPFAVANREKRAALSHFQPHGLLVSTGRLRADRRRLNEAVLDTGRPLHRLAGAIAATVSEEARRLLPAAGPPRELGWKGFSAVWWRIVRRVMLGDAARNDHELAGHEVRLLEPARLHPGPSPPRDPQPRRPEAGGFALARRVSDLRTSTAATERSAPCPTRTTSSCSRPSASRSRGSSGR